MTAISGQFTNILATNDYDTVIKAITSLSRKEKKMFSSTWKDCLTSNHPASFRALIDSQLYNRGFLNPFIDNGKNIKSMINYTMNLCLNSNLSIETIEEVQKLLISIKILKRYLLSKVRFYFETNDSLFEYQLPITFNHPNRVLFYAYGLEDDALPPNIYSKLRNALYRKYILGDNETILILNANDMNLLGNKIANKKEILALVKYYVDGFKNNLHGCQDLYVKCQAIDMLGITSIDDLDDIKTRIQNALELKEDQKKLAKFEL